MPACGARGGAVLMRPAMPPAHGWACRKRKAGSQTIGWAP